jgi:hypothetical protein
MKWYAEMKMTLDHAPLDDDILTALADALYEIEQDNLDVQDADLGASLADGWVTVTMLTEAGNQEDAMHKVVTAVRAATHTVSGGAPGWDRLADRAALMIEPASERAPAVA